MTLPKFSFIEKLNETQLDELHALYKKMWWSTDRTKEEIAALLKNSIPFPLINHDTSELVGFARVLTDEFRYAYIYDVMTAEHLRSKGLGKLIMQHILSHPKLQNVKYFELTCVPEMADYYKKFGFTEDYGKVVAMRLSKY
ncbi:MAG: family N-acetyltransferase [Gammaproteobacteria bacterium]|jgi:GNAT superfamily N-acetyltransferase|nr:family N-acetyltransferase [Gammaproteobacteria bacterium]